MKSVHSAYGEAGQHATIDDNLEVLSHNSRRLAKMWKADGMIGPYDEAKMLRRKGHHVANLRQLSCLLSDLERKPHSALIRGRFVGEHAVQTDVDPDARKGMVRKAAHYFEDQALHSMCIDVDKYVPLTCDAVEDTADAVREFIEVELPAEFRGAGYHWQASNSAGHPSKAGTLRVHIWFWLEVPLTSAQLKAWATNTGAPVDKALFSPFQWHYTANPVFEPGVRDPVPVRSGFVDGSAVRLCLDPGALAAVARKYEPLTKPRSMADSVDPNVPALYDKGLVLEEFSKGLGVVCPNQAEHSSDSGPTQAMYFPAGVGGRAAPGFECQHDHCKHITASLFLRLTGLVDPADDFEVIQVDAASAREAAAAVIRNAQKAPLRLDDFYAHAPTHKYLYRPTRELWPAQSVNGMVRPWPKGAEGKAQAPANWLDRNRSVQQMTWAPGRPELILGEVMTSGGWEPHEGNRVFNVYVPPRELAGDADQAGPWLEHLQRVFPTDWQHLVNWFAHRVQRPHEKVNHAIVLGGPPGIGKDSILVPLRAGVGPSNAQDISPGHIFGAFNRWAAAVLLVISEARDLGESDRFKFYEASKALLAAPPDVIRVNEKHTPEFNVPNLVGVVITTNHRTSGLYLPADDRRHYVAWSESTKEHFAEGYWTNLYRWYAAGGIGHVVAYLKAVDLSAFDAKAPPRKTPAFWAMVSAGEAPEASELRNVLDAMGNPQALTVIDLVLKARVMGLGALADELSDRKSRARIPHMLDRAGYVYVRNESAKDGRFGKLSIYAQSTLSTADQVRAARELEREPRESRDPKALEDFA